MAVVLLTCSLHVPADAQQMARLKIEDLEKRIQLAKDTVLIVNFWATWCKPCVEELPGFHETVRKYAGRKVKLLLVSVDFPKDYPDGIRAFAQKNRYDSEIAWLDETDADHFCPVIDKTWSGAIPATLIIHNGNGYRKFIEGTIKPEALENFIREGLGIMPGA
jgi:thiol-disulfide isomerase/thioredoxin